MKEYNRGFLHSCLKFKYLRKNCCKRSIVHIMVKGDSMAGNRDINKRLCRFPESQISSFALQVAVSNALSKPETVVEFLPLLKQVGFRQRKRVPRDEDGKPIIEDTISGDFDF